MTGSGFGQETAGLTLSIGGSDICETVNIESYGTFTCLTKEMEIQSSDVIEIKTASGTFSCGNTDTSAC